MSGTGCGKDNGRCSVFTLDGHSGLAAIGLTHTYTHSRHAAACKDNDAQIGPHQQSLLSLSLLCFMLLLLLALLLVASIILNATHFVRNVSRPASAIIITLCARARKQKKKPTSENGKCADTPAATVLPTPTPSILLLRLVLPLKCVQKCTKIKIKHDRQFTFSHL